MFNFLRFRSIGFKLSFVMVTLLFSLSATVFYVYTVDSQKHVVVDAQNNLKKLSQEKSLLLTHKLLLRQQNIDQLASLFQTQLTTTSIEQAWQVIKSGFSKDSLANYFVTPEQLLATPYNWQVLTTNANEIEHLMFYQNIYDVADKDADWTIIYGDDVSDKWVMSYGRKVYQKGKLVGVLGTVIEVDPLIETILDMQGNPDVELFLYNTAGHVVYHPNYGESVIRQIDITSKGVITGHYIRETLVAFIENNKLDGSIQEFEEWGKPLYASSRLIDVNNWVLVVYQSRYDILKNNWLHALPTAAVFIGIVMTTWFILTLINRVYVSNRLSETSVLLERACFGELEKTEVFRGNDEIDDLNSNINKLFGRFKAQLEEKDRRIADIKNTAETNKAMAQVANFSDSAVMFLALDFKINYVDSKSLSLLKFDRESLMDTRFFNYIHEDMSFISEQIVNEMRRKLSWRGELILKTKVNGEQLWVSTTITPIRDETSEVNKYVVSMQDISFIKNSQSRIEKLAYTDELTNLANRTFFVAQLEKLVSMSKRGRYDFALLYFDLDDFKRVNDHLGYEAGDQMLTVLANRLSDNLRNEDILARMGGDEFALILGGASNEQEALRKANSILESVNKPYIVKDKEIQPTVSIGITMSNTDAKDPQLLLQHADLAMYEAKSLGKNTYHFYTKELNDSAQERQMIEVALQQAIKHDGLELYFQPKVDTEHNKIVGFEALCRWNNPEMGFVSPDKFIPIAEQSNLILPLGDWVMEKAIQFASTLSNSIPVSINISARQFEAGTCVQTLSRLLHKYQVPAEQIELELTESLLVTDVEGAIKQLNQLKELGVILSIDDFGTGYSSLSYLKRFPVDVLKIDRSFIKDIPGDESDVEITGAIIAMAQKLGLDVIAEGAESSEQVDFLWENGCSYVQGYYFSKPLPADEAREWQLVEGETQKVFG